MTISFNKTDKHLIAERLIAIGLKPDDDTIDTIMRHVRRTYRYQFTQVIDHYAEQIEQLDV